jgi:hypothetical protein
LDHWWSWMVALANLACGSLVTKNDLFDSPSWDTAADCLSDHKVFQLFLSSIPEQVLTVGLQHHLSMLTTQTSPVLTRLKTWLYKLP